MQEPGSIYDLGTLDPTPRRQQAAAATGHGGTTPLRAARMHAGGQAQAGFDPAGTLSLLLPGSGQLLRGEFAVGLFFLSTLGFLAALGWAGVTTLDRITATLRILDYPGAPAIWVLAGIYCTAALLHVAAVVTTDPHVECASPPPVLAGIASAIFPGWGQVLNGSYARAALFILSVWLMAATWILASAQVQARLAEVGIFVPDEVLMVCAPVVRYTAPAVVWALSIYDAASTAAARRG